MPNEEVATLFFREEHNGWQYSIARPDWKVSGWLMLPRSATVAELLHDLRKWELGFCGKIVRLESVRFPGGK